MLKILGAAAAAGVLANVTGYLITGRLFHSFQALTPSTWRASESWNQYLYSTISRIAACVAVALIYKAVGSSAANLSDITILRGIWFGLILWAATILPAILEIALFVNLHRGFVIGLLLDWLVVCILASVAAALAA